MLPMDELAHEIYIYSLNCAMFLGIIFQSDLPDQSFVLLSSLLHLEALLESTKTLFFITSNSVANFYQNVYY